MKIFDLNEDLGFLLAKAYHLVHRRFCSYLRQHGVKLTAPQLSVLIVLREKDGVSINELAAEMYFGTATMTGVIDRLEKAGLARRQRHPEDRRVINVFLTTSGKNLCKTVVPLMEEWSQKRDALWQRVQLGQLKAALKEGLKKLTES